MWESKSCWSGCLHNSTGVECLTKEVKGQNQKLEYEQPREWITTGLLEEQRVSISVRRVESDIKTPKRCCWQSRGGRRVSFCHQQRVHFLLVQKHEASHTESRRRQHVVQNFSHSVQRPCCLSVPSPQLWYPKGGVAQSSEFIPKCPWNKKYEKTFTHQYYKLIHSFQIRPVRKIWVFICTRWREIWSHDPLTPS